MLSEKFYKTAFCFVLETFTGDLEIHESEKKIVDVLALNLELNQKLEEFAVSSDAIEEINENKEQIEISKFYEKLPNPVVIATEEYLGDELHFHYSNKQKRD